MATRTRSLYSQAALDLTAGKITRAEYGPALMKEVKAELRQILKETAERLEREGLIENKQKTKRAKGR